MSTQTITERTAVAPKRWVLDAEDSSAEFAVRSFWGLITVRGRFDRFEGWYEVGPGGPVIEMIIDADSLDTGNGKRDEHLRSADFFHVAEHPLVHFTSTYVRDDGDGRLHVEGNLEAAGTVAPLEFDAAVRRLGSGMQIEVDTAVDHTLFGMSRGLLGMIRPPATLHVTAWLNGAERP